ncbi:hypothetical protein [Holdemanella sp.]|uniref:hypothetical protein n=1 Tax=Holdemanella sp. TaxID=1971762 RepID=UPI0025870995|nr:hypothetical protein [Holdemanella sp.]
MQLDYDKFIINAEIEEFSEIFSEPFYQGFYQGVKEERKRRTIEVISNCLAIDLSLDVTASIVNISVEEVKQCIKENHLN